MDKICRELKREKLLRKGEGAAEALSMREELSWIVVWWLAGYALTTIHTYIRGLFGK
jgi:hypothetical protein